MNSSPRFLTPSQAARRLGVSAKALRLYERRGLLEPGRNAAGWRVYGPRDMDRAAKIAELRGLGLGLAQVGNLMKGPDDRLDVILSAHQSLLRGRLRQLSDTIGRVAAVRADLAGIRASGNGVAFALPWPWGGERFVSQDVSRLTFIVGPLGSGKTRFAERLSEALGGIFLGLDRAGGERDETGKQMLASLVDAGAAPSAALLALVTALARADRPLVIDMVEQGLDHDTQEALIAYLRRSATRARPLFLMTRSSAILDIDAVGADEAIILCPANHGVPTYVHPFPGSPGYEAVMTCLATPDVRARTAGVVACRLHTAAG